RRATAPTDSVLSDDEGGRLAHLYGELQDDILTSYDRDEPPDLDSGMIDPRIGTARIGAGPGDVYIAGDLARAPSRWPLEVERSTRTEIRSKNLAIQIALDQSAAWMSDELSWRIELCGRTAVIPLRLTALYAHDGDRWVPVFEHLSFGWAPTVLDAPQSKAIKTEVVTGDLRDELSGVLARGLFHLPHDPSVVARDPLALVLGPDAGDEWHGTHVLEEQLPAGRFEDRRVGLVGRDPASATVAYWVGNYLADVPATPGTAAGKVRMRVTHVFEKRHAQPIGTAPGTAYDGCAPPKDPKDLKARDRLADCHWVLVQSHMSQPISDEALTQQVFGTALASIKPLALDCSDGTPPATGPAATAPAAAPRRAPDHPPVKQTR
ncbi:MAG TPA: hypothetical protein VH165_12180, partial [Kofleriaceae bacterium]|nr:hypothetical protein [Kofleriaceae bacterium]